MTISLPAKVFVPGRDPLPHYRHSYIAPGPYTTTEAS